MSDYIRRPKHVHAANVRIAPSNKPYVGKELLPPPGTDPRRLIAFTLPSRIGDRLHYPDGRIETPHG